MGDGKQLGWRGEEEGLQLRQLWNPACRALGSALEPLGGASSTSTWTSTQ